MMLSQHKGITLTGLFLCFIQVALADPGRTTDTLQDVEVIANTGYGHTLFDSADKKCQHCHNDLYDTWKTSMHAKSWEDPLFQAKYQDFLRLQISKIGAQGPTGTYGEGTIQKTAQVCVKCHAPTAFYSGDYQIKLTPIGTAGDPENGYATAKTMEANLSNPVANKIYDPALESTVASLAKTGQAYTVSYHIGNSHNREGINCSYCHSIETVRMFNDSEGDFGKYKLGTPIKMGPIGPIVRDKGETLHYSPDASTADMNAFFAMIGPEKGKKVGKLINVQDTAKDNFDSWDTDKSHNGRYVMKSTPTGCEKDDNDECIGTRGHYTGGPFYGPFGVTGLSNSRSDDITDRHALVKQSFVAAAYEEDGDKFTSKHHFAAYGKALCLSCHQRSSLMLNPESGSTPGLEIDGTHFVGDEQFLELCSTWTAMSDGIGNNFEASETSPKCQSCHMEPLEGKTVLHQWDQPDKLFTLSDNPELTKHFLTVEDGGEVGPVAEGYLNNHAFMGHSHKDGKELIKVKSGFKSKMSAKVLGKKGKKIAVKTKLLNKTAHMFPGAHPMRRVLTRIIVTDAAGNKVPYLSATGDSDFKSITNQLAVLSGDTIKAGFETVDVEYDSNRNIVIQGYTPNLDEETVYSQTMDSTEVQWVSPDATVTDCKDGTQNKAPVKTIQGWGIKGCTTVKKIVDTDETWHFTRIYGRETGKRNVTGTHVVRPGFDSNIATDNRLQPNEFEKYKVLFDTRDVEWPVTVDYRVYYLKKGGSGKFPTAADGFLNTQLNKDKKMGITEVARHTKVLSINKLKPHKAYKSHKPHH
jgi:hypothetical protein